MDEFEKYRLKAAEEPLRPAAAQDVMSQEMSQGATSQEATSQSSTDGWGIDINPANEPTYPIRQRTGEEHQGYSWSRPPQQPAETEVLHSNERFNLTAVFGAAHPPRGLSGVLRRVAFRYGEGTYGHWLLLLLADRINVVEGVMDDLRHLRVPNLYKETGLRAEWRYNRKAVVRKAVVTTALVGGAYLLLRQRKKR
jgi:hypothetical protein